MTRKPVKLSRVPSPVGEASQPLPVSCRAFRCLPRSVQTPFQIGISRGFVILLASFLGSGPRGRRIKGGTGLTRKRQVRMLISGRVQGVCFRAYTREEACRLGLKGWVRNLPDGRVEVLAQGDPAKVGVLESWCHQGPPHARVWQVEVVEEASDAEELPPFDITY
jgi:acylphosphatase